nr:hypothetical protein WS71_17165 [Burkholderia mayonis]
MTRIQIAHHLLVCPSTLHTPGLLCVDVRFRRWRDLIGEQRIITLELLRNTLMPIEERQFLTARPHVVFVTYLSIEPHVPPLTQAASGVRRDRA